MNEPEKDPSVVPPTDPASQTKTQGGFDPQFWKPRRRKRKEQPPEHTITRKDTLQDLLQVRSSQPAQAAPQEAPGSATAPASNPTESAEDTTRPPLQEPLAPGLNTTQNLPAVTVETTLMVPLPQPDKQPPTQVFASEKTDLVSKEAAIQTSAILPVKPDSQKSAPPPVPPKSNQPASPKRPRRWRWIVGGIVVLFLFLMGGVVPVEKIPLLRNLAYAMGFSKDDTQRMSFLRALLTWTNKKTGPWGHSSPATEPDGQTLLATGRLGEGTPEEADDLMSLSARMARVGGKTSLIDINALNALQRKKGQNLDGISGTVLPTPGQEENTSTAALRDGEVNVQTESSRNTGDVFFGSDVSAVNRHFQDGYDSVASLKRIANPHISDGHPMDWLQNTARRMVKADASLTGVDKDLSQRQVGWQTGIDVQGETKPHKDLYYAWITSRMSKYTSNNMLKKALAESGFLGADVPAVASGGLTAGGIQIDTNALAQDQNSWREYLEFEKNCREDLNSSGSKVSNAIEEFNKLFYHGPAHAVAQNYNVGFPKNCAAVEAEAAAGGYVRSAFYNNLRAIQAQCKEAQEGYTSLKNTCLMEVETTNRCQNTVFNPNSYAGHWESFRQECEQYCPQKKAACDANPNCTWMGDEACRAEQQVHARYAQGDSSLENVILSQVGGNTDYFPQLVKSEEDTVGINNAATTIENNLQENAAL